MKIRRKKGNALIIMIWLWWMFYLICCLLNAYVFNREFALNVMFEVDFREIQYIKYVLYVMKSNRIKFHHSQEIHWMSTLVNIWIMNKRNSHRLTFYFAYTVNTRFTCNSIVSYRIIITTHTHTKSTWINSSVVIR